MKSDIKKFKEKRFGKSSGLEDFDFDNNDLMDDDVNEFDTLLDSKK